jgi:hypothetical protein
MDYLITIRANGPTCDPRCQYLDEDREEGEPLCELFWEDLQGDELGIIRCDCCKDSEGVEIPNDIE